MSLANTPWPKFRKRNDNNAVADATAIISGLLWSSDVFGPELIAAPPVISADGIYFTAEGGWDTGKAFLVALNPDGTLKWKTQIFDMFGGAVRWLECSPAIGDDGTIYITDSMYSLLAFNPDGTLKWRYDHAGGAEGSLFAGVAVGDAVYCAENGSSGDSDKVIAVSFNGELLWNCDTGHRGPYGANVALAGNHIYVAGQYQYTAPTGAYLSKVTTSGGLVWSVCIGGADLYSPVVVGDRIYILDDNHVLYAVNDADGSVLWSKTELYGWKNAPVVDASGNVYAGGRNTNIISYYPDGSVKWEYVDTANPGWYMSGVILDVSGNVLCLSDETALYILDSFGTLVCREVFTDYTYEMTPVIGNGVLYVPLYSKLIAYELGTVVPVTQCRATNSILSALSQKLITFS